MKRSGNPILFSHEYKVIRQGLRKYKELNTDNQMKKCIDEAMDFFKHSPIHLNIFNGALTVPEADTNLFCKENNISIPGFYIYRREIIWRIAIVCYAMDIFSF